MTKDQLLIDKIKQLDNNALRDVYMQQKKHFMAFFSKYNIAVDDILDIYQDSIVAFCENVRKGKLDDIKSTISTYIIAIGKYKVYAFLKKENKEISLDLHTEISDSLRVEEINEDDERITILQRAFKELGEKCREILTMFYYESKKLDEIQERMQYENKDVLKSQKSRCLKRLKELAQQ
jgi:RNA polymerase sigma factor (sigma-70 family)